jgi:hypothetical protein
MSSYHFHPFSSIFIHFLYVGWVTAPCLRKPTADG